MAQVLELIDRLLDATANGKARWQETASEDAFRLGVGEGIIRIENTHDYDEEGSVVDSYAVTLSNRQGRTIETIHSDRGSYMKFRDLYNRARASALRIDALVESMLADLEAGNIRELPADSPF